MTVQNSEFMKSRVAVINGWKQILLEDVLLKFVEI